MSFEAGSVTFRMFYLKQPLPRDYVDRFAKKSMPHIATLRNEPIRGWVTGRHLCDSSITKDSAFYAGYLRLALCKAERVIPASTLRAEYMNEQSARQMAEGRAELDRRTLSEIRKEIEARLLPTMPPQFKGMAVIHLPESCIFYCEATSDKQVDAFEAAFRDAVGFGLIPVTCNNAAIIRSDMDARDLAPISFSSDCADDTCINNIGHELLTWIWFYSECRGGIFKLPSGGDFAAMVEGPLTFVNEGQGAHEVVVRRGNPSLSTEAKIALLSGKKLSRGRILLARGRDTWQCTLDADQFIFRGLKLPEGEKLDPVSRFQERMISITTFTTAFLEIFDKFMAIRMDAPTWALEVNDIRNWVTERTARK